MHAAMIAGGLLAMVTGNATGEPAAVFEDDACRIEFDARGGLQRLYNRSLQDDCLKRGDPGAMPIRLYADPKKEFAIEMNEKMQLAFEDPVAITRTVVTPATCRLAGVERDDRLALRYACDGLELRLVIAPADAPGITDWSLTVTNTGKAAREFLADFPCLDGIRLGPDPGKDLATAMDHAGLIVPAWERSGGVLGESNDLSMQWHAVWDPATESALAVIFMDADARPKRLILKEPGLQVQYIPPIRLEPGATFTFPQARVRFRT